MIEKQISIETALEVWAAHSKGSGDDHLSMEQLIELAQPQGVEHAKDYQLHHLSLCPRCFEEFNLLVSVSKETEEELSESESHTQIGYGMLKAAKSRLTQPVELTSGCKRFMLGIYPDETTPNKALFVFKTLEGDHDNAQVRVKDANGRSIMSAVIFGGSAAQTTEELSEFDFSTWTVVLETEGSRRD